MATAFHWRDLEEDFFHCSICQDLYKEPKLLPCVHRFCRKCLQKVIKKCLDTMKCPLCKEKCNIPKTGVDGFKTDFHMKSLLEVIQLQKSLDKEEIRECVDCSKQRKAASYCFKCTGFLCETCYQFHLDSPMLKDQMLDEGYILPATWIILATQKASEESGSSLVCTSNMAPNKLLFHSVFRGACKINHTKPL